MSESVSQRQGHLLSCPWTAKKRTMVFEDADNEKIEGDEAALSIVIKTMIKLTMRKRI